MTQSKRGVTVVVHRDGALTSRSLRFSQRFLVGAAVAATVFLLGLAAMFFFYGPIVRAATSVPGLKRDIARLEEDNAQVHALASALDDAEARYNQLREMIGANIIREPAGFASTTPVARPIQARPPGVAPLFEAGASSPSHWPLDEPGYVTRGQVGADTRDEAHPGIDVAVPIGSPVRATGGGTVLEAGSDPETYGLFVLLEHPNGYQSMYGHLSRLTVVAGGFVSAGEVIGLSGNSGRSSAPHLHFEIRRDGRSLDPMTLVQEEVR
ncbi:MAG: M23 family metallopeptidase [Gemmatimonadales bacterium]|nr:M23 family metallopeptidase [Gemmatimonadales bacterium]